MTGLAFGPREPDWCRIARNNYWRRWIALRNLEERICSTNSGMAWFYRVRSRCGAKA